MYFYIPILDLELWITKILLEAESRVDVLIFHRLILVTSSEPIMKYSVTGNAIIQVIIHIYFSCNKC